ncbi:hypothetical protein ABWH88_09915 [Marinobacter adhaerens]|jgi:hypothetical protein|uniref:Uncharacterized protein n=2 Tax=Marinobacter adhaerens TaxID=1033846 RepID=A0ABX8IN67_9GAMM|nr:hypothetical protein [Marinobacter adhaerens]ADP95846.1 hypothetical protein HP15_82 [Marinobacter adhaerens HP15]QWV13894.1 hypothetical protein KQ249_04530 [Marinobacter adhaerens]
MRRWEKNFEKYLVHESLEHLTHWLDVDSTKPEQDCKDSGLFTFAR